MVDAYRIGTRDYEPCVLFDSSGAVLTPAKDASSSACAIESVGDSATSVALAAANTSRKAVRIFNDSTAILYVACTETASATNFTEKLYPGEACTIRNFTGAVNGLWASDAGGNARVSEFT